jgi:hypothetical protein
MKVFVRLFLFMLIIFSLLIFFGCNNSDPENDGDANILPDSDFSNNDDSELPDNYEEADDMTDENIKPDKTELPDDHIDEPDEDGAFLSEFDSSGKNCVTDIPQGKIILATTRIYSDSEAPWRVHILVLKDDGSLVDTEKYLETDSDLRGIGFNSNGQLAAVSSWKTGHITLFAVVDNSVCIAEKEVILPNLKDRETTVERVIFGEVTPHPLYPYKLLLVYGNTVVPSDYSNYLGGIYTMTVDKTGSATISEDYHPMHVPKAFTVLPCKTKAIALASKDFIKNEGEDLATASPEDLVLMDISGKTPEVIKWFDIWGTPGERGMGPAVSSIGTSQNGLILIPNSSDYSEEPGVMKLFQFDGNDEFTLLDTFEDALLDTPDYAAINDEGTAAVVLNSFFKGATLSIDESELSFVLKENHDLARPMIKLNIEPFKNHVIIGSFRSSNDESVSITLAEITPSGLVEKSSTPVVFKDGYSLESFAIQND